MTIRKLFRKLFSVLAVAALFWAPIARAESPNASEHVEARREAPEIPSAVPKILVGEVTTARFRIRYTQKAEGAAKALAQDIEHVRDLFAQTLGRDWPGVTELRVGVGRDEYEAIAVPGGTPPKWSVALAYPAHDIVLLDALSLNSPAGSQTLRHELSHVALGQIAPEWPRWFQEGLAMHLTGERYAVQNYAALFRAVTQDRVFKFSDLSTSWPEAPSDVEIAYAQSVSFVDAIIDRYGSEKLGELLTEVGAGSRFETAFAKVYKTSLNLEEEDWRKLLPKRYSWWPIATGTSTLLVISALLTVYGWARRKRQLQFRLDEMAAEEAAEDAAARILAAEEAQRTEALHRDPLFDAEVRSDETPLPLDDDPDKPTIH